MLAVTQSSWFGFPALGWLGTQMSLLSPAYNIAPRTICFELLMHSAACARCLALASAGSSNPANIAMMAITTSSSISVKAMARFAPGEATLRTIYRFIGAGIENKLTEGAPMSKLNDGFAQNHPNG